MNITIKTTKLFKLLFKYTDTLKMLHFERITMKKDSLL